MQTAAPPANILILNRLTGIHVGTDSYTYGYTGANPLLQDLIADETIENADPITGLANGMTTYK